MKICCHVFSAVCLSPFPKPHLDSACGCSPLYSRGFRFAIDLVQLFLARILAFHTLAGTLAVLWLLPSAPARRHRTALFSLRCENLSVLLRCKQSRRMPADPNYCCGIFSSSGMAMPKSSRMLFAQSSIPSPSPGHFSPHSSTIKSLFQNRLVCRCPISQTIVTIFEPSGI